jgi:hypothetical protein
MPEILKRSIEISDSISRLAQGHTWSWSDLRSIQSTLQLLRDNLKDAEEMLASAGREIDQIKNIQITTDIEASMDRTIPGTPRWTSIPD